MLAPHGVSAFGGLTCDADWIYALDAERGRLHAFTTAKPRPLAEAVAAAAELACAEQTAAEKAASRQPAGRGERPQPAHVAGSHGADGAGGVSSGAASSAAGYSPTERGGVTVRRTSGGVLDPYLMGGEEYIVEKYREEVRARRAAERALTGQTLAEQDAARKALIERQAEKLAASWLTTGQGVRL